MSRMGGAKDAADRIIIEKMSDHNNGLTLIDDHSKADNIKR